MLRAAVLAGGKSSRMGENKALMQLGEQLVIERITNEMQRLDASPIVIANQPSSFSFLHHQIYMDNYTDKGPLAGIEAALSHLPEGYVAITACDTPFISADIYRYLSHKVNGKQAIIPVYNERMHPLSGIYHTNVLEMVRESLQNDELKIQLFLDKIDYRVENSFVNYPAAELNRHFFNMNRPDEYEQALNILNSSGQVNKNVIE